MAFLPFYRFFPQLAVEETRSITLLEAQDGLPPGEYAFIEMYCADPKCDCRRVNFSVLKKGQDEPVASISWGWEPREFYARWMSGNPDPDEIDDCKGPSLNPLAEQSRLSPAILALCKNVLIQDSAYVERIRGHYRLFRSHIDGGYTPVDPDARHIEALRKKREKAKKARKAQKAARRKNRR